MKKLTTLMIIATMALILAACSSGGGAVTTSPAATKGTSAEKAAESGAGTETVGVETARAAEMLKGKKIIYVANECASDWQAVSTEYLKALVNQSGGNCQIFNPENDASKQAQMVEDALVLKPDVLVIKPIDQAAIIPALKKVNEAKIPIILLDTGIIENADVDIFCSIQTDQKSLGQVGAEYVAKLAKEGGYEAKVVTVLGDMSSNIAHNRRDGFNEIADLYDNVTVLAETESKWDPSAAYTAVIDMMTRYPEANTIFCCADCMMSGVVQALNELGRLAPVGDEKHVTIVGIDCDPNGCSYLEQGYVDQEAEHNAALHSDIAYKVIVDYVNGYVVPKTIFFDTTPVTKAELDSSDRWGRLNMANVAEWGVMDQDVYKMQTPEK